MTRIKIPTGGEYDHDAYFQIVRIRRKLTGFEKILIRWLGWEILPEIER